MRPIARPLTLLAALPLALAAQQQARALPAADATYDEPFSNVAGLRELSNGRLIVADARDKLLQLVDIGAGTATKIGREGSGPGEFSLPFRLFGMAGDTTFMFDPGNTRYLVIDPTGKAGNSFRMESPQTPSAGGFRVGGMAMARASDARGRLYYEAASFVPGPNGVPQQADSAPIMRYDRVTQRSDTVGFVRLAKNNAQVTGSQTNTRFVIGAANPLTPRDEWGVFPDGRVVIVRHEPYRVEFISASGARVTAAPFRHTPLRVTEADKREEEALRRRLQSSGLRMSITDGPNGRQTSASMGGGGPQPDLPPLTDWPATKPPFRSGQASVWARPNGDVWIRRTEPAGAKGTLYDVIDSKGALSFQVRIPDGLTLVGFGNGTIYTTKADEDDLLYLQRHSDKERKLIGN